MRIDRRWEVLVEALTSAASELKPGQQIDISGFNPSDPDAWEEVTLRIRARSIDFATGSRLQLFEVWSFERLASKSADALVELPPAEQKNLVFRSNVDLEQLPYEMAECLVQQERDGLAMPQWFYLLTAPAVAKERLVATPGIDYEGPDLIRQRDQALFSPQRFRRETYGFED